MQFVSMLKGLNLNRYSGICDATELAVNAREAIEELEAIYGSDEFRMYAYKIKRCTRTHSHDWTECPYSHRGEKATRRDPRKIPYVAVACPAFRSGCCRKGNSCEYAHGVFEYWLHPSRYRTRPCNAGRFCQRKVCFFAHTPEQLRSAGKHLVRSFGFRTRVFNGGDERRSGEPGSSDDVTAFGSPSAVRMEGGSYFEGVSEFLDNLRRLKINGDDQSSNAQVYDQPFDGVSENVDWISELIK